MQVLLYSLFAGVSTALGVIVLIFFGKPKEKFLAGIPIGRMATPEEQASAIVFLASEKADYMVGATIDVNGGVYMS